MTPAFLVSKFELLVFAQILHTAANHGVHDRTVDIGQWAENLFEDARSVEWNTVYAIDLDNPPSTTAALKCFAWVIANGCKLTSQECAILCLADYNKMYVRIERLMVAPV